MHRGDRTYHLSNERLKAFKALSTLEKLRWQEEIATFIRLTRLDPRAASGDAGTGQKMQEVGL